MSTENGTTYTQNGKTGSWNTTFTSEIDPAIQQLLARWTCTKGASVPDPNVPIPESFDARNKWPNRLTSVVNQAQCGSCWAFAATTAFSDRIRIASHVGTHTLNQPEINQTGQATCFEYNETVTSETNAIPLMSEISFLMETEKYNGLDFVSPYYLASCQLCSLSRFRLGEQVGQYIIDNKICGTCCTGSFPMLAHIFLLLNGAPALSCNPFEGVYACQDIIEEPCSDINNSNCFCREQYSLVDEAFRSNTNTTSCTNVELIACPVYKPLKVYQVNTYNPPAVNLNQALMDLSNRQIQLEVMINGPVATTIEIFPNLLSVGDYVYDQTTGQSLGGHSVVIVGWGFGPNSQGVIKPFWWIRNSWGSSWGDQGYFRILRGQNFCRVESDVWASYPCQVYDPVSTTVPPTQENIARSIPYISNTCLDPTDIEFLSNNPQEAALYNQLLSSSQNISNTVSPYSVPSRYVA